MARRALAIFSLLALLISTGCGLSRNTGKDAKPRTGAYGDPNSLASPTETATDPAAPPAEPPPGPGKAPGNNIPNFQPGAPPPTDEPERDPEEVDDESYPGAAARAMLRPQPFTEIVIEIDSVPGQEPDERALNYMIDTLSRITGKRVIREGGNSLPSTDGTTTASQVREMSKRRNTHSVAPRVSLYLAFLNGRAAESDRILGYAVLSTVIGFYPDRWRGLANVNNYAVEGSIILHEVGHLLAQTEIDYVSPRHRKSSNPAHGNHTTNQASVMYYEVETTGISSVVRGSDPLAFDADDLADFRDMAAGRL
ncbi:MAG TPA: hypothetical protein VND22_01295 [Actinomycetota bacterium]|nr:hypothetical protein [Actinomycetota bacterium]